LQGSWVTDTVKHLSLCNLKHRNSLRASVLGALLSTACAHDAKIKAEVGNIFATVITCLSSVIVLRSAVWSLVVAGDRRADNFIKLNFACDNVRMLE